MYRLLLFFSFFPVFVQAQSPAIGQWRNHVSLRNAFAVDAGANQVFAATAQGVVTYNLNDQSVSNYSRINALSDVSISAIKYDSSRKSLLVGYGNGNIDLITEATTFNLPDIKRSGTTGDKSVRNIFLNQHYAYIATGFGIVVFDIDRKEIFDTYKFGPSGSSISVNDISILNNKIYAATDLGVYSASLSEPFLNNYQNWEKQSGLPNPNGKYNQVEIAFNRAYVCFQSSLPSGSDEVFFLDENNTWSKVTTLPYGNYSSLRYTDNNLLVSSGDRIFGINNNNGLAETLQGINPVVFSASDAIHAYGKYWVADNFLGLINVSLSGTYEQHLPSCPLNNQVYKITASQSHLHVATGGVNQIFNNFFNKDGILSFDGTTWANIDENTDDSLKAVYDFLDATPDPANDNRFYVSSWGGGLIEVTNNKVSKILNHTNSAISEAPLLPGSCRVGCSTFDASGNLWVGVSFAPNNLALRTASNQWYNFKMNTDFGNSNTTVVRQVLVTSDNTKWMIRHRNGLFAFNEQGTYGNASDDKMRALTSATDQGGLPSNDVFCIAEDLDGEIWMGTDKGFAILYSPSSVFSGQAINADQPIIRQDGNYEKVLEQEIILSIAVDGANRKWMATQNSGVYLLSEDGMTQIHHFTVENSPLLSNEVFSVTINSKTGEVFFGTSLGIQSYMSDATASANSLEKISVYPSPVKPDYNGPITMRGFLRDSDVKIADISGNVVFQTKSLGGEAFWDGKNFRGEQVASGIYLIFAASSTGDESTVGKIFYIR